MTPQLPLELRSTLDAWAVPLHLFATGAMTGLIWFVQRVHYPLMASVSPSDFSAFEQNHMTRTTPVVATLMLMEAVSAAWLLHRDSGNPLILTATALLALAWLWTFAVMVPLHQRLARGFDADTHRRLVARNWPRTIAWSLRALVAIWLTSDPHLSNQTP